MKRKHLSYSDEIREQVIHEYVSGSTSTKLSKSWGIPQSTLRDWLKPYIIQRKALSLHSKNNKDKAEVMKKDLESENALLKARIKELEKKTKFLELQVLSRDMMIDIAEKNGIEIRKKSGAK